MMEFTSLTPPDLSLEDPDFGTYCSSDTGDEGPKEQNVEKSTSDNVSTAAIDWLLDQVIDFDPSFGDAVCSQVCGDIFHLHHQIPISIHHGLWRPFERALSAAIFIPNPEDKAAMEAVSKKQGTSWSLKLQSKPHYVLKRVRQYVPPPEILLPHVSAVIKTFGSLKDATTKQPLFNEQACEITQNILENVQHGYYSDPPNIQLYYKTGHNKHGLTLYRCCQGTNDVEGGIHQNLIWWFTSFNMSPCHNMQVNSFVIGCSDNHWHLAQVGTLNHTGYKYVGHFDITLKSRVALLLDQLIACDSFNNEWPTGHGGWVNGNDYEDAGETFGIMCFDPKVQETYGWLPHNTKIAQEMKVRHSWLSERQGTMFAVVPVHTREEHDIFALMMETSKAFSSAGHPDWTRLATEWSNHCNGTTVFYKVCGWPTLWHFSLCSNISIGSFLNTFDLISKFGMITATKKTLSHSTMMLPNVSKHSCNRNRAWYHLSLPCKHSLSKTQYMHTTTHHTPSWTLGTSVHSSITILCSSQLCWWSTMMPLTHQIHLWHQTNKMHRMKHKQRPQNGSVSN
jgi:hypothetical protein